MTVVAPNDRRLVAAVRRQPFGRTSIFTHDIDVHTSFAVGHECNLLSVGTPDGIAVIGSVRRQLSCLSTCGRHCEDVAFIAEGNLRTVGRDGTMPQPQRMILSLCRHREEGSNSQRQESEWSFLHSRISFCSKIITDIAKLTILQDSHKRIKKIYHCGRKDLWGSVRSV